MLNQKDSTYHYELSIRVIVCVAWNDPLIIIIWDEVHIDVMHAHFASHTIHFKV